MYKIWILNKVDPTWSWYPMIWDMWYCVFHQCPAYNNLTCIYNCKNKNIYRWYFCFSLILGPMLLILFLGCPLFHAKFLGYWKLPKWIGVKGICLKVRECMHTESDIQPPRMARQRTSLAIWLDTTKWFFQTQQVWMSSITL